MLHTEMSYARKWPRLVAFQCLVPPAEGGQTPIADMRKVSQKIGTDLIEEFAARNVCYVRNYGLGVDLTWQEAFRAEDRQSVDRLAEEQGISLEWISEDRLRSTQVCQGAILHPITQEKIWFNQAHLFHISNLSSEHRHAIEKLFSYSDLPRNATFGDGKIIPDSEMDVVRDAFWESKQLFDWQSGDALILDNLQFAHGRMPFSGNRKVVVAMGGEYA